MTPTRPTPPPSIQTVRIAIASLVVGTRANAATAVARAALCRAWRTERKRERAGVMRRLLRAGALPSAVPEVAATVAARCFEIDDRTHALALALVADMAALTRPAGGSAPVPLDTTTPEEALYV